MEVSRQLCQVCRASRRLERNVRKYARIQQPSICRQYSSAPAQSSSKKNTLPRRNQSSSKVLQKNDDDDAALLLDRDRAPIEKFPVASWRYDLIKRPKLPKGRIKQDLYTFPYEEPDSAAEDLLGPPVLPPKLPLLPPEPSKQQNASAPKTGHGTKKTSAQNKSLDKNTNDTVLQKLRNIQRETEAAPDGQAVATQKNSPTPKSVEDVSREFQQVTTQILSNEKLQSPEASTSKLNKSHNPGIRTTTQGTKPPPPFTEKDEKGQEISAPAPVYLDDTMSELENLPHPTKPVHELDLDLRKAVNAISMDEVYNRQASLIEHIKEWYLKFPKPRVCYFDRRTISGIFNALSLDETHNNSIASLYLQIFNDMRSNESVLKLSEWTRLIDITGKGFAIEKEVRVDLALKAFQDMQRHNIVPDDSLLTSLLQTAVRAQQWSTASLIDNELYNRKATNLIIWTERIKIAGLQTNLAKVLQTFKDFAASGLPVDIAFVNALLEALLNVGQGDIAESIYLRLRQMIVDRYEREILPARTTKFAVRRKRKASLEAQAQQSPRDLLKETENLVPNRSSIRRFISYHCHSTGRMTDVAFYLNEMDAFGFTPNYGTYVDIFHGFFLCYKPDGEWSADKLANVYSVIQEGLMHGNLPFPVSFVLALTAIRAHGKVFGAEKAREVWEMLRPHLKINENVQDSEEARIRALENLVKMFETKGELPRSMAGGEPPYRVLDWRNAP